ncbi:hypothetical protein L3N51_02260 [Metallosphaera sp. J1]|nr:hypothetical protein [Metallosphaera javensis (ex Hofmann et al. 2022)]
MILIMRECIDMYCNIQMILEVENVILKDS